jgi:diguanylate cyclase (GGDEF)-like protein/PAS domain S-box-containing protein
MVSALEGGLAQHRLLMAAEASLRQREERFRRAVSELPLPAMVHAEDGEVLEVNQAWTELTGYGREEIPDLAAWLRKAYGKHWREVSQRVAALYRRRRPVEEGEFRVRTASGDQRVWVFQSASLGRLPDGRRVVVSLAYDITERKSMEESLQLAGEVFESSSNGILVTDGAGRALEANRAFLAMTGYCLEELRGLEGRTPAGPLLEDETAEALRRGLEDKGSWQGEVWRRRKGGEAFPAWQTVSLVGGEGAEAKCVTIVSDLTDLKDTQARLEFLSKHDPLTGLPNRRHLMGRLEQALERARRRGGCAGVAFLDLDRFRMVNDSLGHEAGDRLLRETARRLKECRGEGDTLARWSGDEFVFVLSGLQAPADLAPAARRILERMAEPFRLSDGERIFLSATLGLASFPSDSRDPAALVQNAQTAVHQAKRSFPGGYGFYTTSMNRQVRERLELENGLRRALELGQLRLHYQPRVSVADGRVRGVEALLRWEHPRRGLVSPGAFLSVAEESGLIIPLGRWALGEACRQMKEWSRAGAPVERVAVNLSGRQFWDSDLASTIAGTLEETGLEASRLELEVTESVVMGDVEAAAAVLGDLAAMGVEISLDDFGTGYSSLLYLKKLPLHMLKVDKSFVQGMVGDRDDASIVRTIVSLAHGMDLKVVVEGVERPEQLAMVEAFGAEQVQGFLFSRPLPPEELGRALEADGTLSS